MNLIHKNFRKFCLRLHLWLGLLSDIVVFIVCITGCLYAFKDEFNDATQPWRFVSPEPSPLLMPEEILKIANNHTSKNTPTAITYGEMTDAVFVDYMTSYTVFINPYTGKEKSFTVSAKNPEKRIFSPLY